MLRRLMIVMFVTVPLHAQNLPDAPKPKPAIEQHHFDRRVFVAGVSLLAASNVADAASTRRLLDRSGRELNPVFGRHPSPAKQAGINAAFFAGQSALFQLTERSSHKWIRWAARALIGQQTEEHVRLAACNSQLGTRGTCSPFPPGF